MGAVTTYGNKKLCILMQARNFLAPSKQSAIAGKRHINSSAGGEVSLTLNSNYLEDPKTDNLGRFCLKSKIVFFLPPRYPSLWYGFRNY